MSVQNELLKKFAKNSQAAQKQSLKSADCLQRMRESLFPQQLKALDEAGRWVSVRCPRRAGKTRFISTAALYKLESKPNSIVMIISLTRGQLKRNFWLGPAGVKRVAEQYDVEIHPNETELRWTHKNGSIGYLLPAESTAEIERLRGQEADVYFIDECKSFAESVFSELVTDILEPQRATRDGQIYVAGTPGLVAGGLFYLTSWPGAIDETSGMTEPMCVSEGSGDLDKWQVHSWTVRDNIKVPGQWESMLRTKRLRGWSDDHPTWQREYLGNWRTDTTGFVSSYREAKLKGIEVNWTGDFEKFGATGLDPAEQWQLVFGLDLGFSDDTAITVAAFSEYSNKLKFIYAHKQPGLIVPEVAELWKQTAERFGYPAVTVVDTGGLGRMIADTLQVQYGVNVVAAKKTEKLDHIEVFNGEILSGRVQFERNETRQLIDEMEVLAWDLRMGTKSALMKRGSLKIDESCADHCFDSALYLFRYVYHYLGGKERAVIYSKDDPRYWKEWDNRNFYAAMAKRKAEINTEMSDEWDEIGALARMFEEDYAS